MKYYKGASTNVRKNRVGGGFKNSGQKNGRPGAKGKEKLAKTDPATAKLRKISKSMFGRRRTLDNDILMRAQLNG